MKERKGTLGKLGPLVHHPTLDAHVVYLVFVLVWILDQAGETGMGKRLERKGPLVSGAPENATQALEHKGP